jgi:hypothetical protein
MLPLQECENMQILTDVIPKNDSAQKLKETERKEERKH